MRYVIRGTEIGVDRRSVILHQHAPSMSALFFVPTGAKERIVFSRSPLRASAAFKLEQPSFLTRAGAKGY